MHLSFAYIGVVLAASAAASSRHLAATGTVARLSARSDEVKGTGKDNVQMKCIGGCNGFPTPPPTACFNAPVICPNQGLPPMNTFFANVQSYTVITTNTVQVWNGGIDPSQMVLQLQIMVLSLATLFQSLQGGCPFQADPQIFISTFAPMLVQIQSMIVIITTQCGGNLGPFQQSFAVLSVIIQAIFGIGYSMQVNIQQFVQVCNFNPQPWVTCGFPANNWINGFPGTFGGNGGFPVGGGIGPQVFPGGNGGFPGGNGGFPGGNGGFPSGGGIGPQVFPGGNGGFPSGNGGSGGLIPGFPSGNGGGGGLIPGFPSGNGGPDHPYGPDGIPAGQPIDPDGIPAGQPIDPDGIPAGQPYGPDGIPAPAPGGRGGIIGFFQPLGLLSQLLQAIIAILSPLFAGLSDLLSGVGSLLSDVGHTVGHVLDPVVGGVLGGVVGGLI